MNRDKIYPGIQLLGKPNQVLGFGEQGLYENAEQANEDWELDNQGPQATHRAYTGLPVEFHGFLGNAGAVAAVTLLDFPHPWLEFAHPAHLPNLLEGQGQRHQPDQDGKGNDGQSHVVETENVQHHQGVEHGTNNYFVPESKEDTEVEELQGDS